MAPTRPPNVEMATKRIKKEIADLAKEDLGSIILAPEETNILHWKARIPGPVGSPYEGGVFDVDIRVPHDYPTRMALMLNILKLLKTAWSPALSLYKVILSLSSLLTDPNPADPLVPPIASEYRNNRRKHDATAREWVKKFALPKSNPPPAQLKTKLQPPALRRTISRSLPASTSPAPPPQVVGQRRVILEVGDSDDEGDIQIMGDSSRGNSSQPAAVTTNGGGRQKRARTSGQGGSAGDAIVIDE
ncbi:ubiquitin-conjugating enzyme 4 [Cryptococcus deuterogattii 99/473]|uniref:Unplaced genomic scaffold supercont1.2, whole genome shotgun sequence n=1 Tax=Cryptococcus deuterogattii Ram5 TaxID=1296110 RepID=A0A0D0V5S4_9TREE|nr:ubiquitin-conjugating enzyme 4 [Cryptococcus deuterogattii LA55]KIR36317.1 ubiquitin-conjugating enzyme 4 [Cryptococcus deuterogattii MMRL2647]KIR42726.1 ubiquitin-conjugating enzyme 4 [Cryptococcus deuterogattii Ram5]KIR75749.1 ubiquitin-conjugating enzyme 4 [Cryptococcus deuterogattii CA1014]KIR95690.1 ubiquitin-conjugating enzyme 4 [Cryptococcus deuterogattii CBS 10090]KIS02186.1 ubiquitin-conjugating enzyme 4 [Cryptococcus deuterogattii 2001/935-1]KIY59407.1 ubiquitin-conjugating enzym